MPPRSCQCVQHPVMALPRALIFLGIFLAIFVVLDQVKHKAYVFDPETLQSVAQKVIAKGHADDHALFVDLVQELNKAYPGHIVTKEDWVFNIAGGAMGHFWLLHGSITEYLIIFGTPIGTEGHTGRFLADDYFIMLTGEQWAYNQGQIDKTVFKIGEMHHLPRGDAQGYKIPETGGYALEYARGWIPAMLPFGFLDIFTSNLDFYTFFRTLWLYANSVIPELLQGKF